MDPRDGLTLASMPTDIIRKIIEADQAETADCLKLISPRWNTCALEFLSDRDHWPPIGNISLDGDIEPATPRVYIQSRYQRYFWRGQLELCSHQHFEQESFWTDDRIAQLLRKASRIEKLELNMAQYDFLPPWLWGVSIEHVEMNEINPWHIKALLDLLVNQNVHYFYAGTVLLDGHEAKGDLIMKVIEYVYKIDFDLLPFYDHSITFWNDFVRDLSSTGEFEASISDVSTMDSRDDLTLASLPTDIVRKIVYKEQTDTVDCMKLISLRWNSLALEFLSDRDRLPPIDNVNFDVTIVPPRPHVMIQERYHQYFGLPCLPSSVNGCELGQKAESLCYFGEPQGSTSLNWTWNTFMIFLVGLVTYPWLGDVYVDIEQTRPVDRYRHALEFLSDRDRLPPVDIISFDGRHDPPKPHVRIHEQYHHHFGLQTTQCAKNLEANERCLKSWTDNRIALLFRRTSRIKKLRLHMENLDSFPRWLGDVPIVHVYINQKRPFDRGAIIEFLRVHKVTKFEAARFRLDSHEATGE
ncbi:hypothetical protein PRIPAC_90963, partial [Pristionchus pacificus]